MALMHSGTHYLRHSFLLPLMRLSDQAHGIATNTFVQDECAYRLECKSGKERATLREGVAVPIQVGRNRRYSRLNRPQERLYLARCAEIGCRNAKCGRQCGVIAPSEAFCGGAQIAYLDAPCVTFKADCAFC